MISNTITHDTFNIKVIRTVVIFYKSFGLFHHVLVIVLNLSNELKFKVKLVNSCFSNFDCIGKNYIQCIV